jgi:hypothetical protein
VAEIERPSTPFWWYALVGVALVIGALWLLSAIVGFLFGIVKFAVVVILAIAFIGWIVNKKADR